MQSLKIPCHRLLATELVEIAQECDALLIQLNRSSADSSDATSAQASATEEEQFELPLPDRVDALRKKINSLNLKIVLTGVQGLSSDIGSRDLDAPQKRGRGRLPRVMNFGNLLDASLSVRIANIRSESLQQLKLFDPNHPCLPKDDGLSCTIL
jgi:ribosomal protein RSM22 (predicted rRNA methylase)